MPDFADRATALEERQREDALAAHKADRAREQAAALGYDPSKPINCIDCSEDIPPERLAAYPNTRRCVGCASDIERSTRRTVRT